MTAAYEPKRVGWVAAVVWACHHRVPDNALFEFNGREVVIKWKGCGGFHHGLACNSPNKTACINGTITLRPFKSLEEAVVASFPTLKSLWDHDGDHAIFARVMECFGIDSKV